jgi:UDP-N-acetylmuramyl pentapeptide phosphotransferase/UDP-N-acetylglucosamine-1-phosphate transferase
LSHHHALANGLAIGVTASLLLSVLVVVTVRWHSMLTACETTGIQKIHRGVVPRVGGVSILLGFAAATYFSQESTDVSTMWLLFFAALPAWLFGTLEDLTKAISTRTRLLATMISALLAWWLTGYSIYRVDLIGIDSVLAFTPIALVFTIFAVGGVAHSINLIDGLNGLAAGTVLICLSALAWVAVGQNDTELLYLALVVMAVTLGFLIINYPFGKIFLGDGGAYTLGFFLAWISVMLVARHETSVSPWAPFLICAYPILETLFSMLRRSRRDRRMDHPDRVHLHSLVFRRVLPRLFPNTGLTARNALATLFLWLFALAPALAGVYWHDSTLACITAILISALLYTVLYRRLIHFKWLA